MAFECQGCKFAVLDLPRFEDLNFSAVGRSIESQLNSCDKKERNGAAMLSRVGNLVSRHQNGISAGRRTLYFDSELSSSISTEDIKRL